MKFFIKDFSTFTEEILNGKHHFVHIFLYFPEFTSRSARDAQESSGILFVIADFLGREYNFGN